MESSVLWSAKALIKVAALSGLITAYWIAIPIIARMSGFTR
jgi:hypothetical protein